MQNALTNLSVGSRGPATAERAQGDTLFVSEMSANEGGRRARKAATNESATQQKRENSRSDLFQAHAHQHICGPRNQASCFRCVLLPSSAVPAETLLCALSQTGVDPIAAPTVSTAQSAGSQKRPGTKI